MLTEGFKKPAIPTFTLVCTIIGSESLTSVFGMGTGITFRIWSPEKLCAAYSPAQSYVDWKKTILLAQRHSERVS